MEIKNFIIYEDDNILVINKPKGILVQQDDSSSESLDLIVKNYLPNNVTGPIHRLDKDTTGLVIFGKNEYALKELSLAIQDKDKVDKHYIALVSGILDEGEVNAPLRKNFQLKKMVVAPIKSGAKEAITQYKAINHFNDFTLLDIKLLTGRTHQIRVHMSYIRHHVIGDYKYGDFKVNNFFKNEFGLTTQFLHSYQMTFSNLNKRLSYLNNKTFIADLPNFMQDILDKLK